MDHVLNRLRIDFQSWTDGPKKVLVHSSAHIPIVHLAEELGVEVLIGAFDDNLLYVGNYKDAGTLFVVGDDEREINDIKYVKAVHNGTDIRHIQL
jgi:hypothetical protein